MSGTGFEVVLEAMSAFFVWKGGGKDQLEGCVRCGGWIFAAVVLCEAAVEIGCNPGVAEGGVGYALQAVDVVPSVSGIYAASRTET
jgi:hypothetical protein